MSEYIPKYPSQEGDDSNKSSSELLAETLKPIYVPQELMLAWESHLASYSRDTHELLDQVKESESALNTQYQALLARVQKYEQMLQDITMDSNEFHMDSDVENFTGWNILAQASYWDYLLKKEITKLRDTLSGVEYRGGLVSEVSDAVLEGLIADNNYISNVIAALSDTPLIRKLDEALNTTTSSLAELREEYVKLAQKQADDAEALANQQVEKAEQLVEAINASIAEQLDRIAQEAAIRTQLLQELEDRVNEASAQAEADVAELHEQVDSIREGSAAVKADILETVNNYKTELKSDIATVNTELLGALDGVHTLVSEVRDENGVTLNELTTYKASNDVALAGVLSKVTTNISDTAANATKISGLTAELATTNTELGTVRNTSANALSKANTAVTANSALATRVDSLAAAITDLGEGAETTVDVYAFNALKAEVETNAAGVTSLVEQVDALGTSYTNLTDGVEANTDAVSTLTVKQSEMNGDISQLSSDVTYLTSELGITNTALNTKASNQALSNLSTKLTTTDGKVAANTQQLTQLNTDLTTVRDGLETKASTEALNSLATNVTELEDGLAVNASAITSLKSEIDTELNKKATVTAVNGLTTKVEEVEGKTTTNANNLLALNTTVGNVVNGLANKLDASAISDYYTKSQTDAKASEVAAGKVEEFSASLVIGGTNLVTKSYKNFGTGTAASPALIREILEDGSLKFSSNNLGSSYVAYWVGASSSMKAMFDELVVGSPFTVTLWFKAVDSQNLPTAEPTLHIGSGLGYLKLNADLTQLASGKEVAYTYTRNWTGITSSIPHLSFSAESLGGGLILTKWKVEKGSKSTDWTEAPQDIKNSIDANSTAIQNTSAEVSRVDDRVTATNSAQSLLEGRVQTVEGGVAKKADASALASLTTRVGTVEGQYTSQASDITKLTNSLDTTNVNVGTAQTAAQNAMNAVGAKGKVIFGNTAPAVADRLVQNLWIDTTSNANTPKRWNGSAWVAVTDKVATDAAKAVKDLDATVKTKADVSALNSLTTKVTEEAGKTAANTSSITTLNSDIVKINNDLTTKANASALDSLTTRVEDAENALSTQSTKVTSLEGSLSTTNTNVSAAQTAAQNAMNQANSKGKVFFQTTTPATSERLAQNLWIDTTNGANTPKRWNGSAWVAVTDKVATDALTAANTALTTKADSSAVTALTNRVTATEGSITTLSSDVTTLKGNITTINGNIAKKADAATVSSLINTVTQHGKDITAANTEISGLKSSLATTNSNVTKKADASALTATDTKVTEIEGKVTSQTSQITDLSSSLASVSDSVASYNQAIQTLTDHDTTQATLIEKMTAELIPHMAGNQDLPAGATEVKVGYEGTITALADANAATQWSVDRFTTQFVDGFAQTQSQIEQINYLISDSQESVANRIDTLEASFESVVNDTLTPAVNSLTARIEQDFITKTDANAAIASATTTMQSSIRSEYTNAINAIDLTAVTIPDTRSANETPQWYWTNYARKKITEFKNATTVGLTVAQVGNTYGTLTTIVPWNESSGGPIRQIMEGTSEANVYVRVSTGTTTWGAWAKQGATLDVKIQEQTQAVDGILGIKTVTIDNNGVMSGYGLVSELKNGQVTSAFGVNANTFYIGAPANNKKLFVVTSKGQEIDGITYPAGTYIDMAMIGNATIGTAKIEDLAVTNAKIANTTITNAKIANLDAAKINTGTLNAARIGSKSITADHIQVDSLSVLSANLGTIQVGTANIAKGAITTAKIGDLQVDTLKIKDRAVTAPHFISKAGITPITLGPFDYAPNAYPVTTFLDWGLTGLPPNQYTMVTIRGVIKVDIGGFSRVSVGSRMYLLIGDTYMYDRHVTGGEQAWDSIFWGVAPETGQARTLLVKTDSSGNLKIKAVFGATTFDRHRTVILSHSDLHMSVLELKK